MKRIVSAALLADADGWRPDCWKMMRERRDCTFCFFTKRIERMAECLPPDWGDGYDNVVVGCTVENQEMAERRLPVFAELPIKRRLIVAEPLLGPVDVSPWLGCVEEVCAGGESGRDARPCDFDWVLALRDACAERGVAFSFHQTGARFVRDGKLYKIPRRLQHAQAKKAGIDVPGPFGQKKRPPEPTAEQLELPL
jgi:protein gp37